MVEQALRPPKKTRFFVDVELRDSAIHGTGVFCCEAIEAGQEVCVWGGQVYTKEDHSLGLIPPHTGIRISENTWLGGEKDIPRTADDFMNHSCDPNTALRGTHTLVAKHDISAGAELTADYSTWLNDPGYELNACKCGAVRCRGGISGVEWKNPSYASANYQYLSDYLRTLVGKVGDFR